MMGLIVPAVMLPVALAQEKGPPGKSTGTLLDRSTLNYGGIIQVKFCFHAF